MSDGYLIPVVYGSVRAERQGIRAARFIVSELRDRGFDPVLVDPLEKRLPLLDKMYKEFARGQAPPPLEELADLFRRADGFCIVSGEYNHGIPPALKNLLDHFLEEYFWRPAAVVTYSGGRWGGVRAGYALRATLAEMGMVTIPSQLPIARVQDAFDENGVPTDARTHDQAVEFLDEFKWYVEALRARREKGVPY